MASMRSGAGTTARSHPTHPGGPPDDSFQETTLTTEVDTREPATAPLLIPVLYVLLSEAGAIQRPHRVVLQPGESVIGRERREEKHICLTNDKRVSRVHAVLSVGTDRSTAEIRDAESRNGTFVNGVRISSRVLVDGDVIRIGRSFFVFRHEISGRPDVPLPGILGESASIRSLRSMIARIAGSEVRVLITGETGSGKEVVARALHQASSRRDRPFVPVNCAAIPSALAESLLFGHTGHAFSGAGNQARAGFFQAAETGTLFLDEVGELSAELQAKLLRVLEEGRVYPVGDPRGQPSNVRVLSATNRNLKAAVASAQFREDLLSRLYGMEIKVPPLRERCEDILLLFAHFAGRPDLRLSTQLIERMLLHGWPFNVRELRQVVEQLLAVAGNNPVLDAPMLMDRLSVTTEAVPSGPRRVSAQSVVPPEPAEQSGPDTVTPERGRSTAVMPELAVLKQTLTRSGGNIKQTAAALGASRYQLYRWLDHYGLTPANFRAQSSLPDSEE